jgi:hypothetical protein
MEGDMFILYRGGARRHKIKRCESNVHKRDLGFTPSIIRGFWNEGDTTVVISVSCGICESFVDKDKEEKYFINHTQVRNYEMPIRQFRFMQNFPDLGYKI